MIPIVFAPTGTGKSDLIISIAESLPIEIISMDSMQIYRKMNIGTAKPSPSEMKAAVHHMIDIVNPDEEYDVYRYLKESSEIENDIILRGKIPVYVGGTGLYMETLIYGIFDGIGKDDSIRDGLLKKEENEPGFLLKKLSEVDPLSYERLHPNDTKRIVRALEVYELSGNTIGEIGKHREKNEKYSIVFLERNREELYKRINSRVDSMLEKGLVEETRELLNMGYDEGLQSMKAIGYRETISFLKNRFENFEKYSDTLKKNTRHYAKRQIIWGRRYKENELNINRINLSELSKEEQFMRLKDTVSYTHLRAHET